MKRYISEGMTEYLKENPVPWHMPGHKRKKLDIESKSPIDQALHMAMAVDVTEVPGTDDLYNPKDMIKDSLDSLAKVYKTYASYYLVNGATGGILIAIAACFKGKGALAERKKILVARNCHKSVYNAVELLGLEVVYIYPEIMGVGCETCQNELTNNCYCMEADNKYNHKILPDIEGAINPAKVEEICKENPDLGAFVLTSPTYEGVVSDIEAIAKILKKYGVKLIVDEAHGAHFPFMEDAPKSAIECGADIVVQSLHKTMESLTQTAILHVVNESLDEDVRKYLAVFMTSSPSYMFMYSMEKAIATACNRDYKPYVEALTEFRGNVKKLRYVNLLEKSDAVNNGAFDYDETRLVLTTSLNKSACKKDATEYGASSYITGTWLGYKLDKIGKVVVEMTGTDYAVLISTAADNKEDFDYLYRVLLTLDKEIGLMVGGDENSLSTSERCSDEGDASGNISPDEILRLIGSKAVDNIYVYPPGSYMLTEGEVITEPIALKLIEYVEQGKEIRGKLL